MVLVAATGEHEAAAVEAGARVLGQGRSVGLPTDTVYGLAVDPKVVGATDEIFAVKGRPRGVLLPVLVGDVQQAWQLVETPSYQVRALMNAFWPGPLTIVMPRRKGLDIDLGDDDLGHPPTVGVRCPAHRLLRLLCSAIGPLAVTSANRHGEPAATTAAMVAQAFGNRVPLVLDGGECNGSPSTVVDCSGPEPVLLRAGAISWEDLLSVL